MAGALAGGAAGALLRAATFELLDRPELALLSANLTGSFIAGFAAVRLAGHPVWATAVVTGFCGGLTSLSTWAVQVVGLADDGDWLFGISVFLLTAAGALAGATIGRRTAT